VNRNPQTAVATVAAMRVTILRTPDRERSADGLPRRFVASGHEVDLDQVAFMPVTSARA
jgi:hypothetical protein